MKFYTALRFGLIFIVVLQIIDVFGQGGGGEAAISVVFKHTSLRQVLDYVEREAGVKFVYSTSHLDIDQKIDVDIRNASLRSILNTLLTTRGIRYIPQPETNFIVLATDTSKDEVASQKLITGRVVSGSDQALPSVSVVVRGTTRGAITDATGNFKVEASPEDVLVFTYIGFERSEVAVGGRSVIDVLMKEEVPNLKEVMVNAGYWQTPEAQRTGNISKVTAEQISALPAANVLQALQGNVPGVFITPINGVPGGGFRVEIRGRNSIRLEGNDPLYIIDGVPYTSVSPNSAFTPTVSVLSSPLNSINPNDIESIEILKDADATAIYGSRGANGVILITTRRGHAGATEVTMNVYSGVGNVAKQLDLLNSKQWLEMRREAFENDKIKPTIQNAPDLLVWDTTRYTDWQKELIGGTAGIVNGQFSIGGGDERTQFNVSGAYRRETTVFPRDFAYTRGSGHLNLRHTTRSRKLLFNLTTQFGAEGNSLPQFDATIQANSSLPVAPAAFDSLGKLTWVQGSNPHASLYRTYGLKGRNFLTNALINYTPVHGLQFRVNLGYALYHGRETGYEPISSYNPDVSITGRTRLALTGTERWVAEPQAEYTRYIGQGKFSVLVGTTFLQELRQVHAFIGSGYTSDALLGNLRAAPVIEADLSDYTLYRYMAVFGRLHYAWRDKYLINLTGRRDGSSRFGPNRQFSNFGAIGVAWVLSEEDFMKTLLPVMSFGKLRASYGVTGSDQIGDYQYMQLFNAADFPYENSSAITPIRLVNPDFAWESNRKFEISAEAGFIQDRILLSASWYRNRSGNQLVGYPLPEFTGQLSVQGNLNAIVDNTGWEFSIRTINFHRDQFSWTTSANLTIPRNRLVSYPGLDKSSYASMLVIGKPVSALRRFQLKGVNPETGLYEVVDFDGDGEVTSPQDLKGLRNLSKKYYGAVNSVLRYRGWSLDCMFQFVRQNGLKYISLFAPGDRGTNQPVSVMARWQKPGDQSSVQRFTARPFGDADRAYSFYRSAPVDVEDASFIRLRSVTLAWQFPAAILRRMRLQRLQLYAQGQNALTFTGYSGRDPETQNLQYVPPLRIFTGGVNVTF